MTNSQELVQFETSIIQHMVSLSAHKNEYDVIFFKSPEKQLENIQGCWWIELSSRKSEGSYLIRGFLHLQVNNKALLKSGLYPHVDFILRNERLGTNGNFVGVNVTIHESKNVFSGLLSKPVSYINDNVIVILTLRSKRMIKNSTISHHEIEDHWTMTKSFSLMYYQDDFKNFTFIIGNQEFKVHKCVFAGKSDVLKTMFMSEFEESKSNSTNITDIDPEVFQVFLDFMYGDKDEFYKKIKNSVYSVYAVAHKYEIKILQYFCVEYIFENCIGPDHAIESYTFASFYGLEELKEKCWQIIKIYLLGDDTLEPPKEDIGVFFKQLQHRQEELENIKSQIKQRMFKRVEPNE